MQMQIDAKKNQQTLAEFISEDKMIIINVLKDNAKNDYESKALRVVVINEEYEPARSEPFNLPCGFHVIETDQGFFHRSENYYHGSPYGWHRGRTPGPWYDPRKLPTKIGAYHETQFSPVDCVLYDADQNAGDLLVRFKVR